MGEVEQVDLRQRAVRRPVVDRAVPGLYAIADEERKVGCGSSAGSYRCIRRGRWLDGSVRDDCVPAHGSVTV